MAAICVTGGSGFIGSELVRQALAAGHRVAILTRTPSRPVVDRGGTPQERLVEIAGDLARPDWRALEAFAPEICIHCAWIATPGIYLDSPENARFRAESLEWARGLFALGLRKFVGVGSCLEYESSPRALDEAAPRPAAPSRYARAKLECLDGLRERAPKPDALAWMRIFHAYGLGEDPRRFLSWMRGVLQQGRPVLLRRPDDVVDYIHVDDIAAALLTAISPEVSGIYNVGTGRPRTIREIARLLAEPLGGRVAESPASGASPQARFADPSRLCTRNWTPQRELETVLASWISETPLQAPEQKNL